MAAVGCRQSRETCGWLLCHFCRRIERRKNGVAAAAVRVVEEGM